MTPLPRTLAALNAGLASGLHSGAQLFAAIDGQPVADLAIGLARLDPPTPMTPDTLMLWLSAGKPLTAAAIAILVDRRLLTFDDPIIRHIPEFAPSGTPKAAITLRHLLTHTAGIRALDNAYPNASWPDTLQRIYRLKIERDWIPGQKAAYHNHTSWYLLGELINRLTHTPHDLWIRQNLLEPLHMTDTFLSLSPAQYQTYESQGRFGCLYDTSKAIQNSEFKIQNSTPFPNLDSPLAASRPRPSASARGPIRQLANFYLMLLNAGSFQGAPILSPQSAAALTSPQRVGMFDHTFRQTIDWSLGLILNSAHHGPNIPYQYGPHASPQTFGHGGSQSSTAFCDPAHRLTVALLFNGRPGEKPHDQRLHSTLEALYQDLHLA